MQSEVFQAIEQHDLHALRSLIASGVNLNLGHPKNARWVPLMSAIEELSDGGPIEAVMLLLRHGASVNVDDPNPETTPLLVAVLNRQLEAARMLIALGADPNVWTDEGQSPLLLSVEQDDLSMAALLLISGAVKSLNFSGGPSGMNALGRAAWMLNIPMLELLLQAGADPNKLDSDHQTASQCLPPREAVDPHLWDKVWALLKH